MGKIFLVGGGKGGVGKSTVTLALLDILSGLESENIFFVETDNETPDVLAIVRKNTCIPNRSISQTIEDWAIDFGKDIEMHNGADIVVNMGPCSTQAWIDYSELISAAAKNSSMEIVILWCIDMGIATLNSLGQLLTESTFGPLGSTLSKILSLAIKKSSNFMIIQS